MENIEKYNFWERIFKDVEDIIKNSKSKYILGKWEVSNKYLMQINVNWILSITDISTNKEIIIDTKNKTIKIGQEEVFSNGELIHNIITGYIPEVVENAIKDKLIKTLHEIKIEIEKQNKQDYESQEDKWNEVSKWTWNDLAEVLQQESVLDWENH